MVVQRTVTNDEFEAFLDLPENEERRFELVEGEIVEKVPTEKHSIITGNLYTVLREFVKRHQLGRVVFEVRYRIPEDAHNARLPDVAFTRRERLQPVVEEGAVPQLPDLCIEVQSPKDTPRKMREKAAYYLANGAQQVWLVYAKKQMVEVLYANGEFDIFTADETLTGGDLLPGFAVSVRDLFEEA